MISRFKNFNENILDKEYEEDEIENKWEVRIDYATDSFWEYKQDAIDRIIEVLDIEGDLSEYEDENGEILSNTEISDMLYFLDESDFYDKLDELKDYVNYTKDIRLINISDEDEIEFLE